MFLAAKYKLLANFNETNLTHTHSLRIASFLWTSCSPFSNSLISPTSFLGSNANIYLVTVSNISTWKVWWSKSWDLLWHDEGWETVCIFFFVYFHICTNVTAVGGNMSGHCRCFSKRFSVYSLLFSALKRLGFPSQRRCSSRSFL